MTGHIQTHPDKLTKASTQIVYLDFSLSIYVNLKQKLLLFWARSLYVFCEWLLFHPLYCVVADLPSLSPSSSPSGWPRRGSFIWLVVTGVRLKINKHCEACMCNILPLFTPLFQNAYVNWNETEWIVIDILLAIDIYLKHNAEQNSHIIKLCYLKWKGVERDRTLHLQWV